jgi:hypothetical protein
MGETKVPLPLSCPVAETPFYTAESSAKVIPGTEGTENPSMGGRGVGARGHRSPPAKDSTGQTGVAPSGSLVLGDARSPAGTALTEV